MTRLWMPIPVVEGEYQKVQENRWSGNARIAERVESGSGAAMVYAEFAETEKAPVLEVVSRFQTRDRGVDWSKKTVALSMQPRRRNTPSPTKLMPTDGIVKETAERIVQGKTSDLDKTRAIYDWVLANTYREPKIRGCGLGDIRGMLETRNFGGKCADLNGLFVVGASGRNSGAAYLRHSRRSVRLRLPIPRLGRHHDFQVSALPRRGVPHRLRVGADGPRGRGQSCARGDRRIAEDRPSLDRARA